MDSKHAILKIACKHVHLRKGSVNEKIICALLLSGRKTAEELAQHLSVQKRVMYVMLSNLRHRNAVCIEKVDNERYYMLTPLGKWLYLCSHLDLNFIQLAALAYAYHHYDYSITQNTMYIIPAVKPELEKDISLMGQARSRNYVWKECRKLLKKNLCFMECRGCIELRKEVYEYLTRHDYGQMLKELYTYVNSTAQQEAALALLQDEEVRARFERLLPFIATT